MAFYEVFCESYKDGILPVSCQRAVLTLLPKKGDLNLLKNLETCCFITTEYKILSSVSLIDLRSF